MMIRTIAARDQRQGQLGDQRAATFEPCPISEDTERDEGDGEDQEWSREGQVVEAGGIAAALGIEHGVERLDVEAGAHRARIQAGRSDRLRPELVLRAARFPAQRGIDVPAGPRRCDPKVRIAAKERDGRRLLRCWKQPASQIRRADRVRLFHQRLLAAIETRERDRQAEGE
jgi:hypothetical protein